MGKKKKTRKKPFKHEVGEAILEGAPFDLSKANGEGYTKISQLITAYMLRDLPEVGRHEIWNEYLEKVENILPHAFAWINENTLYHVHRYIPVGARNVEFLALIKSYRHAGERNADRAKRRAVSGVRLAI